MRRGGQIAWKKTPFNICLEWKGVWSQSSTRQTFLSSDIRRKKALQKSGHEEGGVSEGLCLAGPHTVEEAVHQAAGTSAGSRLLRRGPSSAGPPLWQQLSHFTQEK